MVDRKILAFFYGMMLVLSIIIASIWNSTIVTFIFICAYILAFICFHSWVIFYTTDTDKEGLLYKMRSDILTMDIFGYNIFTYIPIVLIISMLSGDGYYSSINICCIVAIIYCLYYLNETVKYIISPNRKPKALLHREGLKVYEIRYYNKFAQEEQREYYKTSSGYRAARLFYAKHLRHKFYDIDGIYYYREPFVYTEADI